jgi:hypothetical protein
MFLIPPSNAPQTFDALGYHATNQAVYARRLAVII